MLYSLVHGLGLSPLLLLLESLLCMLLELGHGSIWGQEIINKILSRACFPCPCLTPQVFWMRDAAVFFKKIQGIRRINR